MTENELQLLVHDAYAGHVILTNLGFEPAEVFIENRNVVNATPPGTHIVVRLQRGELAFILHLRRVTRSEAKRFFKRFRDFLAVKAKLPREHLDNIVRGSQVYAQRADLVWGLVDKGFELRPGEMVN